MTILVNQTQLTQGEWVHAIRCPLCPQTKIKLTIFGLGSTARQNLFKIHPAVLPIKDRQTDRQTNRQTNRQRYCLTVGFNLYLPVTSKLKSLGVTIDSNLRFDCHARNVAKAATSTLTLSPRALRAQSTDWRRRPDSRVQHRRFQAGLLQCAVEWRTGGDFWQTTARPEQPGQSRLPEPGSHRRQAAA